MFLKQRKLWAVCAGASQIALDGRTEITCVNFLRNFVSFAIAKKRSGMESTMAARIAAIILAAGKGSRMNSNIPKQYLTLLGKPVLFYSLQAFEKSEADEIILVTGCGEQDYCKKEIVDKYQITKVTHIVDGGAERYHSVYRGLLAADGADYVLIHDGARPLVSVSVINEAIGLVKKTKACVAGMPVKDTIQLVDTENKIRTTPVRKQTWLAQTPQCFSYELAMRSYDAAIHSKATDITDDAMVIQRYGTVDITMFEAGYENIKVTTPEDIAIAECLLKNKI